LGADINIMDKDKKQDKNSNYSVMESLEAYASKKFIQLDNEKRKVVIIAAIALSVILMIASSIGYALQLPTEINVILGAPSGIAIYLLLFIQFETLRGKLTAFKEKHAFRARWNKLIKYWAFLVPLIIFTNIIPLKSIGGAIIVAAFLASLSIFRKTEKENYYAANGLIDPREMEEDE